MFESRICTHIRKIAIVQNTDAENVGICNLFPRWAAFMDQYRPSFHLRPYRDIEAQTFHNAGNTRWLTCAKATSQINNSIGYARKGSMSNNPAEEAIRLLRANSAEMCHARNDTH